MQANMAIHTCGFDPIFAKVPRRVPRAASGYIPLACNAKLATDFTAAPDLSESIKVPANKSDCSTAVLRQHFELTPKFGTIAQYRAIQASSSSPQRMHCLVVPTYSCNQHV
eukprot:4784980-Amphidinium_carterae.1